jgi:hypothetical protein
MANENKGAHHNVNASHPIRHTIASYNMSFASDLGDSIGSEKHFIHDSRKRAQALGLDNGPRSSWKRAAQLVRHFWMNRADGHHPSAIGLQEMNTATKLDKNGAPFPGGDRRIQHVLRNLGLAFYSANVEGRFGSFPTLVTIWKEDKLGGRVYDYVADLGMEKSFETAKNIHKGRPISMIYTTKGFTLINLHGPNISDQSYEHNMEFLREAIHKHVDLFVAKHGIPINPAKLFVMGDFNDPFNAINREKPLRVHGTELHYNTLEDGMQTVNSCCYNFDSACPDGDRNKTGDRLINHHQDAQGYDLTADPYECFIREDSDDEEIDERISGTVKKSAFDTLDGRLITDMSMGARGHLANYQYTGDYVMGANVVTSLKLYRKAYKLIGFRQDVSLESDHEMVFATFASPVAGGRMRRTHKATRAHHKQRHTRHKALRNRRTRRNE